ncbi:MAG: hypothetical protein FWG02_10090 [Holophagaceae bacterium]|nr:hypothetical protein [Holophagaceae bacterium]
MFQQIAQIDPLPVQPKNFEFKNYHKAGLIILIAAILYRRLNSRRRKKNKVCTHCEASNPYHRSSCHRCSAPLLDFSYLKGKGGDETVPKIR